MAGVPLQGYHRSVDASASMVVRLAGLVPMARASGAELTRAETVTLFDDRCVLAPATLLSPAIVWKPGAARTTRARFANAQHAMAAEPSFGAGGELGAGWSTPLGACRSFGPVRLASTGEPLPDGRLQPPGV
jgi:hypothetical protein